MSANKNGTEAAKVHQELEEQRRKVDVDHFDLPVRELVRMAEVSELHTAPEYQRKFRWSEEDESRFIESLFLGIPVPSVFVAANKDGTWDLVDGLQRVSTLIHFAGQEPSSLSIIDKPERLVLKGLPTLTHFNGASFASLPTPIQLQFSKRFLRVTVLSDKSDPLVRYDLFERLNKGGVSLTPQEVRACVFRGHLLEFIEKLAVIEDFARLLKLQVVHQDDGTKEEVVLKVFAYLHERGRFDGRVEHFLNEFLRRNQRDFDYSAGEKAFRTAVSRLYSIIEGPILRRGYNVTPLNQAEAIIVAAVELVMGGKRIKDPDGDWLNDPELVKFSTKGTNTRSNLIGRIERAKALLSGK